MITLADITRFTRLYPTSFGDPAYAFAGGSAVQCWLHGSIYNRKHNDIDIFAFDPNFIHSITGDTDNHNCFFSGSFPQDGVITGNQSTQSKIDIVRGGYYDSEITPDPIDVRQIIVNTLIFRCCLRNLSQ